MLSHGSGFKVNGVTLIEMMISITIGIVMISFITQLMVVVRRSADLQTDLFNITEKATNLSSIFKSQLKRAGFIGCARLNADNSLLPAGKYSINIKNRLVGSDHEVTIRYMDYKTEGLIRDVSDRSVLLLAESVNIHPNEVWIISNCQRAEWFEVANISRKHGVLIVNLKQPLSMEYDVTSEVGKLKINRLYSKTINNQTILLLQEINSRSVKLVEKIRDLNFRYTIYSGGKYLEMSASQIHDWSQVNGVAISAILQSGKVKQTWQSYYVVT